MEATRTNTARNRCLASLAGGTAYFLASGPVMLMAAKGMISERLWSIVFYPLVFIVEHIPPLRTSWDRYMQLWIPWWNP